MTTSIFKPHEYSIDDGQIITIHITNISSTITLQRIFEECLFFKFGEIVQIVLKGYIDDTKKTEAYVDFKYFDKRLLEYLEMIDIPIEIIQIEEGEGTAWFIQKKKLDTHFYIEKNIKGTNKINLIIHSINSSKTIHDVNYLFREMGIVDQLDLIWSKDRNCSLPIRAQAYVYFKEWENDIHVCKFFKELRENNMMTIKYDYNGYKDLLWVYELFPSAEKTIDYGFEFGDYYKGVPDNKEGWENDKRMLKNNNLSWYFTSSGKLAYSDKIGYEEIKKYGGIFIEDILFKYENDNGIENDGNEFSDENDVEDINTNIDIDINEIKVFPKHYNIFKNLKKYKIDYSTEIYNENDDSLYIDEDVLDNEECKKMITRTFQRTLDIKLATPLGKI